MERSSIVKDASFLVTGMFKDGNDPKLDLPCDTCRFFYLKGNKGRCKLEKSVTNARKDDDCAGYELGRVTGC
ncbi:MAG TPA: hypothetical protein VLE44_01465 [Candidatus Saccharimonadales bacterium]|nr:hypothetical protein [Candidatus Saccharimonadales bacterium]